MSIFRSRRKSRPEVTQHVFDTEPLIGWRIFQYSGPDGDDALALFEIAQRAPASVNAFEFALRKRLTGVGYTVPWYEGEPMVAECKQGRGHTAPTAGCYCGLWGLRSMRDAIGQMERYHARILARVAYWGHFIEHEGGFRAQYAYPQEIILIVPWGAGEELELELYELGEKLSEQYGVPARVHRLKLLGRPRQKSLWIDEQLRKRELARQKLLLPANVPSQLFAAAPAASAAPPTPGMQGFAAFQQAMLGTPAPFVWPENIVHPGTFWQAKIVESFLHPDYASMKVFPPDLPF